MRKQLVYDLVTRLFHWSFATLFLVAFFIAKQIDSESPVFPYHMLAGLSLGFLVILRLIWGIFGTKHAKFSDFALKPSELFQYFKGFLSGSKRKWAGHNPASSWAALVMMVLGLGLVLTGFLMTSSANPEDFEDIHEIFANCFIVVVVLHVLGLAMHTLRHKEFIGLSMIDGKKAEVAAAETIESSRPFFGILLLALLFAFGLQLCLSYDDSRGTLRLFGITMQLSES